MAMITLSHWYRKLTLLLFAWSLAFVSLLLFNVLIGTRGDLEGGQAYLDYIVVFKVGFLGFALRKIKAKNNTFIFQFALKYSLQRLSALQSQEFVDFLPGFEDLGRSDLDI